MQTYEMTIPEPVTATDQDGDPIRLVEKNAEGVVVSNTVDKPWPLYRVLCIFVLVRIEWRQPFARSVLGHEIAAIFKPAEAGTDVTLNAEQWEALRDTIMDKEFELPEHYSYHLAPLLSAVLAARPKKLAAVPESTESATP